MPDRTGIFLGWSANLSNFLGLGVEAGASPMYPQKMRVLPLGAIPLGNRKLIRLMPTVSEAVRPSVSETENCLQAVKKL